MNATVLIADDSGLVRAVLSEQLAARGYSILQAADGDEALAVCRAVTPDIVLLDVDMPILDGHQVLTALRGDQATSDIPVVFLTGRIDVTDAAEGLRLGAHDYLRKPVEPVELMARMSGALRIKELQDDLRRRNADLSEHATQLEYVNTQLTAANQLAADLIAMLSHDLRQPLSTIIGYTDLLTETCDPADEQLYQGLARTNVAARQLGQLIEDVLVMAQTDAGAMPTRPEPVEVSDALRDALSTLSVGVESVTIDQPLRAVAYVDPVHLRQILSNLIGNAFKYGDRPITIEVTPAPEEVEIRVSDRGLGVPADFVGRIFDRFARADSGTATTKPGTGLGLYIVHQLALANRGTVRYEPHEPTGSSFVVRLPVAVPPVASD